MHDTQLYEQILGLIKPWHVTAVALNHTERALEVRVDCGEQVWACPTCNERMHVHGYEERRWRHLNTCQYQTIIVSRVPRVSCGTHGTQMVRVPWAEKHSRFTCLFERFAIDVLQECSQKAAGEILGISWDEADGIKQRAVNRGLARKQWRVPTTVCFDEKAAGRGHDYVTVVTRVEAGRATVDDVIDGRDTAAANAYWERFPAAERAAVAAVGMDMWQPYFESAVAHVPDAAEKIVHDRYHLVTYLNAALDEVRRDEHTCLLARGDRRLNGTRRWWLYGKEHLARRVWRHFKALTASTLKTAKAWLYKELFREMFSCPTRAAAEAYFKEWYRAVMRSRLHPMIKVAQMFKRHVANIMTWFTHHLSNSFSEGINNLIQSLIKKAYGYRNRERLRRDILFHAGALDLYPGLTIQ